MNLPFSRSLVIPANSPVSPVHCLCVSRTRSLILPFLCSVGSLCVRGCGGRWRSIRGGLWVKTTFNSSTWMLTDSWSRTRSPHVETGSPRNTGSLHGLRLTERLAASETINQTGPDQTELDQNKPVLTGPTHCQCESAVMWKPPNVFTFIL